jgi:hypothetical protein
MLQLAEIADGRDPAHAVHVPGLPVRSRGGLTVELEADLGVHPVAGDLAVLDLGVHFLDVDRLDVPHRLGGLRDRRLDGFVESVRGFRENFDDLQHRHG